MFPTLFKASRFARKGKPVAAMLAVRRLLLASAPKPKPKRKPARPVKKSATPAKPAPKAPARKTGTAPAARIVRPAPGSFVDGRFSSPHGDLAYKLYTPQGSTRRRLPLVVMLHGCTQSAADFAAGTGMNRLADAHGFLVLYPEQAWSANMARCWNWHLPANQERDGGETGLIAMLTRHVIAASRANSARVYIAGLSAGGAAAALVGAAYPDLYAAVGVHSGVARGNVRTMREAISAMRHGSGARTATGDAPAPPLILFHGDRDTVVHPVNADGFLSELRRLSPCALTERTDRGRTAGGRDFTRTVYRGGDGEVVLEGWIVHGGGHGWSGGSAAASYTDPAGPDASSEMIRFFLAHTLAA